MYLDYDVPFATVKEREVKDVNYKDDRARLDELNRKIKQLEPVNMMAIDEYKKEGERYEFLSSQRDDITASIDDLKKVLKDVDNRIRDKFSEGFKVVQENFKKLFYEMFDGGKAELILADADDVLESNIDIIAEPPGKRFKNIGLLSGGRARPHRHRRRRGGYRPADPLPPPGQLRRQIGRASCRERV